MYNAGPFLCNSLPPNRVLHRAIKTYSLQITCEQMLEWLVNPIEDCKDIDLPEKIPLTREDESEILKKAHKALAGCPVALTDMDLMARCSKEFIEVISLIKMEIHSAHHLSTRQSSFLKKIEVAELKRFKTSTDHSTMELEAAFIKSFFITLFICMIPVLSLWLVREKRGLGKKKSKAKEAPIQSFTAN